MKIIQITQMAMVCMFWSGFCNCLKELTFFFLHSLPEESVSEECEEATKRYEDEEDN